MAASCGARRAFLGLGANLGERRETLGRALELLGASDRVHISQQSTWHETQPVGGPADQPDFLNGVCCVVTTLSPEELLVRCQEIEAELGRVRAERDGPRTIDIDLLWYEGETRSGEELCLPHPRWEERVFVMAPLAEIAPEFVLPGCRRSVMKVASELLLEEVLG
jgi:2-amino-4-hydroxy-6-hydroxymethyldihydropteridine diphosphokinase